MSLSTIIETLVQIASDASIQKPKEIEQLLVSNNVDKLIATAILNKDIISLERKLDVCPDIVCIFVQPKDDEPAEQEEDEEQDKNTEKNISVINF